jgi:diadenylate cyclase
MSDLAQLIEAFLTQSPLRVGLDVLDVLLVAFLIYRVLLLVRGTRAMQMAIGLGLVFVTYQVSRQFGLYTLYTLLNAFLTYIVLLVVVLFQNDIRRVLTRVGTQPFLRGARHQRELQAVEEVVKAAVALAHKHIGGLVVFERDALLDEFIQQGTVLDAAVSKELLYSIFVPSHENPMHDGAVVIREGRLWQAGVFLPLSGSPKLDRSLGTRHRAAIGISEETDAVVVVVSEERGAIGICFNGNMVRDLDAGSLRQALLGLFQVPVKKKTGAKQEGKRREETGRVSLTSVPSSSVPPPPPPASNEPLLPIAHEAVVPRDTPGGP